MKMLINGQWVDSSNKEVIEIDNPYTGQIIDSVPSATKEDGDFAISEAVKAQKIWNAKKTRDRAAILRKFLDLLKRDRDKLAAKLTEETGKPVFDSYGEIDSVYMTFESSIEIVKHHFGKGLGIYMTGFVFSAASTRMLLELIMAAGGEAKGECIPDNMYVECAYYPEARKLVIINNSGEVQKAKVSCKGKLLNVQLGAYETMVENV